MQNEFVGTEHDDMKECIDTCTDCAQVCEQMVSHCLSRGGDHASPDHIRMLLDCVAACETSAGFMLRGSPLHVLTCGLCARVCRECAEDCARLNDDEMMQECIEVCTDCARVCEQMSHAH